jgi:hypothetical protein
MILLAEMRSARKAAARFPNQHYLVEVQRV